MPLSEFASDLERRALPAFSLVVPDLCHSMHDCSRETGDAWLKAFLAPLLASPQLKNGVVFVVFDEGKTDLHGCGHVAALAIGPTVRRHSQATATLDHYSILRTIEDNWGLPLLGASATANPVRGIWRTPKKS